MSKRQRLRWKDIPAYIQQRNENAIGMDTEYPPGYSKAQRKFMIELFDGRCAWCGGEARCTHHIDFDKANCSITNLTPLCRSCHGKTFRDRAKAIEELVIIHLEALYHKLPDNGAYLISFFRDQSERTVQEVAAHAREYGLEGWLSTMRTLEDFELVTWKHGSGSWELTTGGQDLLGVVYSE